MREDFAAMTDEGLRRMYRTHRKQDDEIKKLREALERLNSCIDVWRDKTEAAESKLAELLNQIEEGIKR